MDPTLLASVRHLTDDELLAQVQQLAAREREVTAVLIAHLAELDARRLYLAEGWPSLFAYCTQVLRLSEHATYGRIQAARAARKFPMMLDRLADGSVNLTTVVLLAPHLTPENHRELLDAVRHQSKRDVEKLVAQLRPQPPVPASVRRLPPPPQAHTAATTVEGAAADSPPLTLTPPPPRPAVMTPLAPARFRIQFTASTETCEKLRRAQDLLRHQVPDGDVGQIIDRALTALLQDLARKKLAATDRPRDSRGIPSGSRHIPAEVKRAVWLQDGGRCAFVSASGRRCSARGFLEFHHVVPYAAGGQATMDNIQLRCRAHNGYEAERSFGRPAPGAVRDTRATYSVRTEFRGASPSVSTVTNTKHREHGEKMECREKEENEPQVMQDSHPFLRPTCSYRRSDLRRLGSSN